jgi:outer membrane protein assembly factor BamB
MPVERAVSERKTPTARRYAFLLAVGLVACEIFAPDRRHGPAASDLLLWRNSQVAAVTRVAFDDHALYTLATSHVVSALDKQTGKTLWQTQLATSVPSRHGDGISLAAGHLIIGDIDLFALDPATGQQVWKFSPSVGAWPGYSKQWTDGNVIICGSATGHVYAVDAATGVERWATHIVDDTNTNVYTPVVSNGIVFVGYTHFIGIPHLQVNGGVAALDVATGRLLWANLLPHGDSTDNTGVWGDPDAIVLTPSMVVTQVAVDRLYGLDRETGSVLVTRPAETFANVPVSKKPSDLPSIATSNNLVIVASSSLVTLTALSADDLEPRWKVAFVFGSPTRITVSSDRIYSGAGGGQFAVYDLGGKLVWTIDLGDLRSDRQEGFYFPAAIDADRIYLPGNFEVYSFKKY